jgi:hypothetical protein
MAWYDKLTDAGEWLWEHSPAGITQEFMDNAQEYAEQATDKLGITNVDEQEEAYEKAQKTLEEQQKAATETYSHAQELLGQSRQSIADIIGPENVNLYKSMIYAMDPEKYVASSEPLKSFEFERDVSKYMDPAAKFQIDESVQAALQGMTGQGGVTGGSAARALQAEASQKASELYGDAWERMMKSTEQEYGKERDVLAAEQKAGEQRLGTEQFRTKELGNLFGSYVGNLQGYNEDIVNMLMAQMGTNLSLAQAMAQLGIDRASAPTWLQQMLGMGGQAASIYGAVK